MSKNAFFKIRLYLTGVITIAIGSLLAWDYFHGGVPSHNLLAREDLPAVSNWWGGLLIPLLSWLLLYRIQKRVNAKHGGNPQPMVAHIDVLYGFIGALLFGTVLSIFFTIGNNDMPFYMMMGLLASALFVPIYRAECLLGYVLSLTFTFGGVLPILIGSVLALLGAFLYLVIRPTIIIVSTKALKLFQK